MSSPRSLTALRRCLAALVMLVLAASAFAACGATGPFAAKASSSQSYDQAISLDAAGVTVRVEMFNGSIKVRAGDAGTVHADVTTTGVGPTQAEAEADRAKIQVTLGVDAGVVTLRAVYPPQPGSPGNRSASAEVVVPAGVALDLHTSNGAVTTTGVTGAVGVETSNGVVTLSGLAAGATIRTSNGGVDVDGSGLMQIETSNAKVSVTGESSSIRAHTSNGAVSYEGSFGDGAQVIETSNASITVSLPAASRFSLDASTSNAKARIEGFTFARSAPGSDTLKGSVGTGGPSVVLRTTNGSIDVRAR